LSGGFEISNADPNVSAGTGANSSVGAEPSAAAEGKVYDLRRLEQVVGALVSSHQRLQQENAALRADIDQNHRRIRGLDEKLLQANQRRQDVAKRIDELIAQIDHLGAQLDSQAQSLNE
jgi:septal ring factor EnvC (AmiA/AmiB activator)